MASIGGGKLTKDRIHANKIFSANLVSKAMLPMADFCGSNEGFKVDKSKCFEVIKGEVLNVPVIKDSPWSFELEIKQIIPLSGSDIYVCKIHNVMAFDVLKDESRSLEERTAIADPAIYTSNEYFSLNPTLLGSCGDWKDLK
jgi:flavin reductase (DIM6/NTAB) family NADH-FMN oxidoreductase RutF